MVHPLAEQVKEILVAEVGKLDPDVLGLSFEGTLPVSEGNSRRRLSLRVDI